MQANEIRPADPADRNSVCLALVDAFQLTPDALWLEPDNGARFNLYRRLAPALFDFTMRYGFIDVAPDHRGHIVGAAVWWPFTAAAAPDMVAYAGAVLDALGDDPAGHTERLAQIGDVLNEHHPAHEEHHYLAYMGVRRYKQSQGFGGALLAHHLQILDRQRLPAYLVATSPMSAELYRRHGFTVQPGSPFHLPAAGPPMWAMRRPPALQP